jgi:hypothetical protein
VLPQQRVLPVSSLISIQAQCTAKQARQEHFGDLERQIADAVQEAAESEVHREHEYLWKEAKQDHQFTDKKAERDCQFEESEARRDATLVWQPEVHVNANAQEPLVVGAYLGVC